jgi:hypothetical protein
LAVVLLAAVAAAPAAATTTSVVDGIGGGGGRVHARIAEDTAAIVRDGVPWVFYGANPEYGYRLRLATLGAPHGYLTLDGAGGGNGRSTDSVGTDISAIQLGGVVHVFYLDSTAHTLRHAWLAAGVWHFQTLDGAGGSGGRTSHAVGSQSVASVFGNRLNVFYADTTAGTVRRAVLDAGGWHFSVVDGNSTSGGRTTADVGAAIKAGIWGNRLHLLYDMQPSGLREAKLSASGSWTYATISTLGNGQISLLKVSESQVDVAYVNTIQGRGEADIETAHWNGASWSVDNLASGVEVVSGVTLFRDGGNSFLAAGIVQCYGSGGCDENMGIGAWNGSGFNDPYLDGVFEESGSPPGSPSSAVTINGVGHLFVGGFGYESEPDIYDQVLQQVVGPL